MIAVFDTSSLHALCKYYLPLDRNGDLKNLVDSKCLSGEIVVIEQVINEARTLSGGIIINMLSFLNDRNYRTNTNGILPNLAFFNHLNNDFVDQNIVSSKGLDAIQVQNAKDRYVRGADGKLLIYSQSIIANSPIVVTEESRLLNDGKTIKKIPVNGDTMGLQCCTLPILFKNYYQINITF